MNKDDLLRKEMEAVNRANLAKLLTRDEILEAQDLQTEIVEAPEWDGSVKVQGLTGTERDAFEADIVQKKGKDFSVNMRNIRAKLVATSLVNGDGKRIFTDKDVVALGKKSAAPLDRIFTVAQRLSGISTEDVEELAKNLDGAQKGASGSS